MAEKTEDDENVFHLFESFDFGNSREFQEGWRSIRKKLGDSVTAQTWLNAKLFFFSKQVKPFDLEDYILWKKSRQGQVEHEQSMGKTTASQSDSDLKPIGGIFRFDATQGCSEVKPELSSVDIYSHDPAASAKPEGETDACQISSNKKAISKILQMESPEVEAFSFSSTEAFSKTSGCSLSDELPRQPLRVAEIAKAKPGTDACHISNNTGTMLQTESLGTEGHPSSGVEAVGATSEQPVSDEPPQPQLSLAEVADLIANNKPIPGVVKLDIQPTNTDPTPSALARKAKPWQTVVDEDTPSLALIVETST